MDWINKKYGLLILLGILLGGSASVAGAAERPRIAVLLSGANAPYREAVKGFHERLRELKTEYDSVEMVMEDNGKGEAALSWLKSASPSLVYAVGTEAARVAKTAFDRVPVVVSMVLNPVDSGLVKSLSASGNNLTGAVMDIPPDFQFERMKAALPGLKRVGVLYSNSETGPLVSAAKGAAKRAGIELIAVEVAGPAEVPTALGGLLDGIDLLWSVADSRVFTRETIREILTVTLRQKVPFAGLSPSFVRAGALMAFETDPFDMGRQAGGTASRLMKGTNPSAIPLSPPEKVQMVFNANTIDLIGISIPKTVLDAARIIEP